MRKNIAMGVLALAAAATITVGVATPASAGARYQKHLTCTGGLVPSGFIDPAGNGEGEVRISNTQNGPAYIVGRSPNGGQIARASATKSTAWVTLYTGSGVENYGFSCAAQHPSLKATTN